MKAIILAGGLGTRLHPVTKNISKQLLPIYDKPMIFYPLTTLMLSGIKDYFLITSPKYTESFKSLFDDGNKFGINIKYIEQKNPDGIPNAFKLVKKYVNDEPIILILGDNIFYGHNLVGAIRKCIENSKNNSTIFSCRVSNPREFGVIEFDKNNKPIEIKEKPIKPKSNFVVTGLYIYTSDVFEKVYKLKPSLRGETEISDLNNLYLKENKLNVEILKRGISWFDTGNFDSMLNSSMFVNAVEKRQGFKIAIPDEVAWRNGWINDQDLEQLAYSNKNEQIKLYLLDLLKEKNYE